MKITPVPIAGPPVAAAYQFTTEPAVDNALIVAVPVPQRVASEVPVILFPKTTEETLEYPGVPPQEIILQRYFVGTVGVTVKVVVVAEATSCQVVPLSILDCHWNTKPSVIPV